MCATFEQAPPTPKRVRLSKIDRQFRLFSTALMGYSHATEVRSIETIQAPLSIAALLEIVCPPRVTHCISVRLAKMKPCFGLTLWSAAKQACLDQCCR